MFSTRCKSSMHSVPGRHSSRRLQLAQLTSNLAPTGLKAGWMAITVLMASPLDVYRGALRDGFAYALEFPAFVEEAARPEPPGKLAVRVGGKVGQHVEIDFGRLRAYRAQHVEAAAAAGEAEVEHHDFGPRRQDFADRRLGVVGLSDDRGAGDGPEHRGEPLAHRLGVFDQENVHAASLAARRLPPYRRRLIFRVGIFLFCVPARAPAPRPKAEKRRWRCAPTRRAMASANSPRFSVRRVRSRRRTTARWRW